MSITRVRSRWLVAWDGVQHRLIPNGELVHRNDQVIFVGSNYHGDVDHDVDARDQLVLPGFINLHVHAGSFAVGRLYADHARREPLSLGFLHYAAPTEGASSALKLPNAELAARATLAEALRYGCSTVVEIGGETGVPSEVLAQVAKVLGVRLYTGIGFHSSDYRTQGDGSISYQACADGGYTVFAEAIAHAEQLLEQNHPLVRPMLFPLQLDTCEPALLQAAAQESRRLDLPLQLHAAQGLFEYQQIMQWTGLTPVRYLESLGLLSPRTIIAHGVYLSGHSTLPYAADDDLDVLASGGAALVHCPTVLARRGIALETMERYRRLGIPMAIGTDTYPRDLLQEARLAAYLSRVLDRDCAAPSAWTLLSAITNTPADILGRSDLGRLAQGCQADYLTVSLGRLRHGPIYDPISTLMHTGLGEDVTSVVIAGRTCLRDGMLELDEGGLVAEQQSEAEQAWQMTEQWHFLRASAEQLSPETTVRLWDGLTPPGQGRERGETV